MGVHVVCKVFRIYQLFRREARASTLCGFPLQNMDHMLLNLGRCVCVYVCWGGGGGGVEEGAEEKKKEGKEGGEGRREIEGEGKQGKWRGVRRKCEGKKDLKRYVQ